MAQREQYLVDRLEHRVVATDGVQMIFVIIVPRVHELDKLCEYLGVFFAEVDMAGEFFLQLVNKVPINQSGEESQGTERNGPNGKARDECKLTMNPPEQALSKNGDWEQRTVRWSLKLCSPHVTVRSAYFSSPHSAERAS